MTDEDRSRTPDEGLPRDDAPQPDPAASAGVPRHYRAPGDPSTTGSVPVVGGGEIPPPRPSSSPYLEIRYASAPAPEPVRPAAPPVPPAAEAVTTPVASQPPVAPPAAPVLGAEAVSTTPVPATPAPAAPQAPAAPGFGDRIRHAAGEVRDEATHLGHEAAHEAGQFGHAASREAHELGEHFHGRHEAVDAGAATAAVGAAAVADHQVHADAAPPARKSKGLRKWLVAALVAIIVVGILGFLGRSTIKGWLPSSGKDFDSATGGQTTLVEIPDGASITQFGTVLADAGVVGSSAAFVKAAGNDQSLSAGYYELPKGIKASTAVQMMQGDEHRVGRIVIPEGLQLDSKKGVDGKTTPGIFEMLQEATTFEADGKKYGVTVKDLDDVAAKTPADELGVPEWAKAPVEKLTGDHRRIEGLIASGAWEDIDPRLGAKELLKTLISRSTARFEQWGVLNENSSGLLPYDTLVVASIVEREVSQPDDYPKVARVILNRMAKDQRLEMDSTVNYTAGITDIDVKGKDYEDENPWNTYQKEGLPATPIGAIGEKALEATENPADGKWLYFVTVDKDGTTLFANTFAQHKQNRQKACDNKLLTTGCN
ncbi:MAG: endolytic transglycosylase MltG [Gordonia sp. (in: high G+C Gram-positive bacteria)]|uniref:endolytic transglycosylase MltG n=1 Tax=Gordonia sp. (in: high G+C Gram-positive bacteria) TaxID=84139 RepID=UPI0039E603B8